MPPNRFVEMFTRGSRRGRTADDEGDHDGGGRRGTAGLRSDESTPATRRPASAAMPPSLTSSRVALISCDGTADGSGAAPERSDAEMGLTTGFTPRRRLPSADDRRRRAGSAGVELGGGGGIGKRGSDLGGGGEHKAPPGNSQQHQQQRHATFLPLPPLPIRLRRRTSTAHGGGGSSVVNTPRAHSRRDTNDEDDDDDSSPSTSSSHSTLAVDATAADVPPANPAPPKPPSLLRAVAQWWRVAILWFKSPSRWRAIAWSGAAIGLSLGVTMMYVEISYVQSSFMTALSGKDAPGFKKAVLRYAGIIAVAAPLFALSDWVEDRLKLAWRAWLASRLMGDYFGNAAFYRLHLVTAADCAAGDDPAAAVVATVDNPDQRICDDVTEFAESSVALAIGVIGKIFQMAAFSGVLWSRMPRLVGFIFGYALIGTIVTASVFGRKLAHLTFATLRREGDLRFDLVRTRESAEAIAFYGGGARERRTAQHKLDRLVKVRRSAILWTAGLSLWTNAYSYATILVPSVMCAPLYFSGKMQFGVISQVTTSFNHIEAALNFLVNHLARVSALAAVSARLESLQAALVHARGSGPKIARETVEVREEWEEREQGGGVGGGGAGGAAGGASAGGNGSGFGYVDGKGEVVPFIPPPPSSAPEASEPPRTILRLSQLTVCTPAGGRTLTTALDLELRAGQSLLIVGPSGCGKSSLLRAVAGLWTRGGGVVAAPAPRRCFFLPQKPYMPLGPLRDQLIFPADSRALARAAAAEAHRRAGGGTGGGAGLAAPLSPLSPFSSAAAAAAVTATTRATDDGSHPSVDPSLADDSRLLDLLDAVALPRLAAAVGGLDADVEWSHVLSLGEQQRVAAARLLAARPALAFLDEATSAMDAASEALVYGAVAACVGGVGGCFVSVGHRPELAKFHSHVLESAGDGRWRLVTSREWVAERRARALAEAALEEEGE